MSDTTSTPPPESSPLFSAARWQELRALLEHLTDASAEVREAELLRITASDPELAASLRDLLGGSLDTSTLELGKWVAQVLPGAPAEMPARIGPFRLLQRIGVGGMGTVYLAEREHADFVQRVALKLLDGGSTRLAQLASRERRILAALTHPHITAFVDAGTENGRAWIAMEYVDGQTLIEHCQQRDLDARARVHLFDQVCAAVAHAHAQLVVHRDLKPSNVLVDTEGRAKLLDFGIALVLDDDESAAPATRVFTPEYAAPEQLRGERVTTASDVYSLGLILYELIVGKRLSTLERTARDGEWTTAELAHAACTRDAAKHSDMATQRDAKLLSQLLRGDLGRIIAHAVSPLPTQRYASVASLREDLARWQDNRPLAIAKPDLFYVLRRFVQRHRLGVASAALALLAIIGLAGVALWQAQAKSLEAANARVAQRQAEATRDFMNSVFLSADPFQSKGAQTTAGELLAAARLRIDQELEDEPEVAASLLNQIGNVYVSLGDRAAVQETMEKALVYNARSARPSIVIEGGIKARLAYESYSPNSAEATLRALKDAIDLLRSAGVEGSSVLANALRIQANVLFDQGNPDAVVAATEGVRLLEGLDQTHTGEFLFSALALSDMLVSLERHDEALASIDRSLQHRFAEAPEYAATRIQIEGVRARALTGLKRFPEAERSMEAVIKNTTTILGREHGDTRYWRYRRAELLEEMGRLDEAQIEIQALIDIPSTSNEHVLARSAHLITAARLSDAQRDANTAALLDNAMARACGDQGNATFCTKATLLSAQIAIREGRLEPARATLKELGKAEAVAQSEPITRRLNLLRARLARASGDFDTARTLLDAAQIGTDVTPDETALLDIERGHLALAAGDRIAGVEALARGRAHIAQTLSLLTPQVHEIDSAMAAAKIKP